MKLLSILTFILVSFFNSATAQQVSKADLGTFPYFRSLPNFKPSNGSSDSVTYEQQRVYLYDGKKIFSVDGQASSQYLKFVGEKSRPSAFQLINEYDRVITAVGGKKIYTGQVPGTALKAALGSDDIVELFSKGSMVKSAHYGIVEWVIKQPNKEVWVQLQPYSIESNFYCLLVVEKKEVLISTNINKQNQMLEELNKTQKSILNIRFIPDSAMLDADSGDEILKIAELYQKHPDWKLRIEIHNAPLLKPDYVLDLTKQRAKELENQLFALGVKSSQLEVVGLGDTQPVADNGKEVGRIKNNRVVVFRK